MKLLMKWIGCFLAAALLLTAPTGCQNPGQDSLSSQSQDVSEGEGEVSENSPEEIPAGEGSQPAEEEPAINSASQVIPGAENLAGEEHALFLLKEYGPDMPWSEANQLENLERGTPYDEVGEYDVYFLLIPRCTGARVEVSRLEYDDDQGLFPVETLYRNEATPDSYGLILTSNEPETMPNLSVTVEYGGKAYTHNFSYDGRGDRPAVQLFGPAGVVGPESTAVFGLGLDGEGEREIGIGDSVGAWTLADLQISYDQEGSISMLEALFEGPVEIRGEISPSALLAEGYDFQVAKEDEGIMPCYVSPEMARKDAFHFMLDIPEDLAGSLNLAQGQSADCRITVSSYRFVFAYMMAPAGATVVELELV